MGKEFLPGSLNSEIKLGVLGFTDSNLPKYIVEPLCGRISIRNPSTNIGGEERLLLSSIRNIFVLPGCISRPASRVAAITSCNICLSCRLEAAKMRTSSSANLKLQSKSEFSEPNLIPQPFRRHLGCTLAKTCSKTALILLGTSDLLV